MRRSEELVEEIESSVTVTGAVVRALFREEVRAR